MTNLDSTKAAIAGGENSHGKGPSTIFRKELTSVRTGRANARDSGQCFGWIITERRCL